MKKVIVSFVMMVMMLVMATTAYGLTAEEIDDIIVLHNAEKEWALSHDEFCEWAEDGITENGILRGLGMVTKEDPVFYDATPDTICRSVYCERIQSELGVNNVVINNEVVGFVKGYGVYHLVITWDESIDYLGTYSGAKGMDMLTVFYN